MNIFQKHGHHEPIHKVLNEKERISKLSQIREIIFGAQDGLLVPLGVVSSVAGAFLNNHIVIVSGIAEGLAGAFSMATGAYLSSQAEAQVFKSEIDRERAEIDSDFSHEQKEMQVIFEHEGLSPQDAAAAVELASRNRDFFTRTMIQKELGLDADLPSTEISDGVFVGISYLINSIIPLFPYFFLPVREALPVSIALTLLALFALGNLKARFAKLNYIKSGLQVMMVGAFSGLGGYLLGTVLPNLLHIKK